MKELKAVSPLGTINTPTTFPWQQTKQMDDDALSIMQKKPMLVPSEEGLRDIILVEAIYKSAATGGRRESPCKPVLANQNIKS